MTIHSSFTSHLPTDAPSPAQDTKRSVSFWLMHGAALCAASIRRSFLDHLPLYACALLFNLLTLGAVFVYRLPYSLSASMSFLVLIPPFLMFGVGLSAARQLIVLMRQHTPQPARAMGRWLGTRFLAGERPGNMLHTILTLTPLMISFDALKEQIPKINPFSWDMTFMHWDHALGFDALAWQTLQPVLAHPPLTAAINFAYDFWFVMMFGCLFWQAFTPRGGIVRMQFLLAFALSWFIGGNVLAAYFSSAGPCFYGYLHPGHDPYAAQMAYLHATGLHWPVWSMRIQDMLWNSYVTGSGAISGISAMPSMHVVIAVLLALLGWRTARWLGVVFTAFATIVVIGSIHLAWHYAVDTIAGIGLAFAFWLAAGIIVRAHLRFIAARPWNSVSSVQARSF